MSHFTYILTPYKPIREIRNDDFTSYQVLLECSKEDYLNLPSFNQKIIDKVGFNNTIYGIQKNIDSNDIELEYYFYTHSQIWNNNFSNSWNTFRNSLDEYLDDNLKIDDIPVKFDIGMFSIDIPKSNEKISDLDIYDMKRGGGFCYRLNKNGFFNKNQYSFFYNPDDLEKGLAQRNIPSGCLIFGNRSIWFESVCISLKKNKYWSIYYSMVKIDTLILFLKRLNYPINIINYFTKNKDKLDHLLFDLGYDFNLSQGGFMDILRGGFYGYF